MQLITAVNGLVWCVHCVHCTLVYFWYTLYTAQCFNVIRSTLVYTLMGALNKYIERWDTYLTYLMRKK